MSLAARVPDQRAVWLLVRSNLAGVLGGVIVLGFALVALTASLLAPFNPTQSFPDAILRPPGEQFLLGTDGNGMDVLSRTIYGARYAFGIMGAVVGFSAMFGVPIGLYAGYRGGWFDEIMLRVMDTVRVFPSIILAIALVAATGQTLTNVIIVIGILDIPVYARLVRAEVLALRRGGLVEAAVNAGNPVYRILLVHLLPNCLRGTVAQISHPHGLGRARECDTRVHWPRHSRSGTGMGSDDSAGIRIPNQRQLVGGHRAGTRARSSDHRILAPRRLAGGRDRSASEPPGSMSLLEVANLHVHFVAASRTGVLRTARALNGVGFAVERGETLGLVGETGAGKSLTAHAVMGLLRPPARLERGSVRLEGRELIGLGRTDLQHLRGSRMGLVVQSPKTSLDPLARVGDQVARLHRAHTGVSRGAARERSLAMMAAVGIPDAERRYRAWPHELSGGMAQRVVIAMALVNEPQLLIADEPTTSLDVTVQAQILDLLRNEARRRALATLLITHDLGVVAQYCDRVAVMYAGTVVEQGPVAKVFSAPAHPYTRALLASAPDRAGLGGPVRAGEPPDLYTLPAGCMYAPRCIKARAACALPPPHIQLSPAHVAACHLVESPEA